MRAFNDSQNGTNSDRSTSSCSYCRDTSHQVTDCPHVKSDWGYFQRFEIPCMDPANWTNNPLSQQNGQCRWNTQDNTARWFKDPSGWSKWYAQCEKAYEKVIRAEQRKATKATGKRAKPKCGFCGSPNHNRRACPSMDSLNERLIRANAHWRQRFYDRIVTELGLGTGALIKVSQRVGHWNSGDTEQHIGIVTSINFDEVNMFCYLENGGRDWRTRIRERFQQPFIVKAVVDGEEKIVNLCISDHTNGYKPFPDEHGTPLIDVFPHSYRAMTFLEVVSPTEQPLSEEWIKGGQQECVEFITKRYSRQALKDQRVLEILENYEQRYNLL